MMSLGSHVSAGPGDPGVVVDPVPPGISAGRWTVSRTALSVAGGIVIVVGVVYFTIRALRARRASR